MIAGSPKRCWMFVVLCAVLGALGPARVGLAQDRHGWFVVEVTAKDGAVGGAAKTAVVHLPPPDRMSPRGSVRNVQGLTRAPERLAWSGRGGSTVYILMPGERVAENEVARRVYSISATAGLVSGWEYVPGERPETLPTIAGTWGSRDLEVVGFAATASAPVVLMKHATGPFVLLMLEGSAWVERGLPWGVGGKSDGLVSPPRAGDRCRLVTAGETIGVLIERAGSLTAEWCVAALGEGSISWDVREVKSDPPVKAGPAGWDVVCAIENQLIRVTIEGDDATLSVLGSTSEHLITTVKDLGPRIRVAPVEGSPGFVALLSGASPARAAAGDETPGAAPATEAPEAVYRLVEITPGGRVVYDGPAKQGGPVSVREIQVLSVLLVVVMAAVIVFVLRPEKRPPGELALPKGVAPAESGRRVMATVLDMGASWVVASMVVRLDLSDVARPEVMFGTAKGWLAVVTAAAVVLLMGVVMEWQMGMTVGKMLLGCRVVPLAAPAPPSPADGAAGGEGEVVRGRGVSFLAALVRNVGKWTPWNVVEFLATGRQRSWADRMARTVVVVPDMPEEESGG